MLLPLAGSSIFLSKPQHPHAGKTLWKSIQSCSSKVILNWLFQPPCRCQPWSLFDNPALHWLCVYKWVKLLPSDWFGGTYYYQQLQELSFCSRHKNLGFGVKQPDRQSKRHRSWWESSCQIQWDQKSALPPGADRWVQLCLGFGVYFQLTPPRSNCAALQHLHTAGSGVKPELTSQRGLVFPAIPTFFCSELHAGQHYLMNEKNIWSCNCSCGFHGAELKQIFTAKCTRTMLLSVLLLEFSISIPKCVKTKIIQVFTLLYWLFQSDVHQCLHNYLSEIIQQTPFKLQDCTSGWAVHFICTVKNSVEGSRDLC